MCDTVIAMGSATARGGVLFAKNSDRERNEAQALETCPARPAEAGRRRRLTYIEIDDEAATHACLISRPFWMWGAEMGANEHGVTIGNEAMHALIPAQRRRALTGMDLVRLGLERAASAAEAVEVITTLLGAPRPGRRLRPSQPVLLPERLHHRRSERGLCPGDGRPRLGGGAGRRGAHPLQRLQHRRNRPRDERRSCATKPLEKAGPEPMEASMSRAG